MLFNVADFVGRFITHWIMVCTYHDLCTLTFNIVCVVVQVGKHPFVLLLLSTLRVSFVPLFLLCNVMVAGQRTIPLIFNCDIFPVVFNLLFALSNGYLSSVAMVAAPQ